MHIQTYPELLAHIDSFDVVQYARTRNHLDGGVSRLSPYITRGVISLPTIRDRVLARHSAAAAEKFIQELAWREYWQLVWSHNGEAIFRDMRFPRTDWAHHELVTALLDQTTGITVIDQAVETLYTTGYMHNHARMWVAMLASNVAKADWFPMSQWLYYHLIDGDLASNMLSWQWVAGTNAGKRYVANQELINGCSGLHQTGTYLDCPRDLVGQGPVPDILQAHQPCTFAMIYPETEPLNLESNSPVCLYSPWTLDPLWRASGTAMRVLVIDRTLFDRFPVSPQVLDFILAVAREHIPGIQVYVGTIDELVSRLGSSVMYVKESNTTRGWPGTHDAADRLFPAVTGQHSSFFSFWQACQKSLS